MSLNLTRLPGQSVVLQTSNGPVVVKVSSITDKRVTLTIHATPDVVILREELLK